MSFSEYFSNYIKNYNISIPKLSKTIGIERASLYRYLNGERLPKNQETVESIAGGLCMKAGEREQFLTEYDKSIYGEDVVNSYLYIHYLLNDITNADDFINPKYAFQEKSLIKDFSEEEKVVELSSKHAVLSYVMRMFKRSADRHDAKSRIMLVMQPTCTEIQELLLPFFGDTDIRVDQIICFEKSIEKCYINLDILKNILPQSFNLGNYNVYYHYDNITSHLNSLSLLPNMIVTESCAMMFDFDMRTGFFSTDKGLTSYLTEKFHTLSQTCFTLLEKGSYANDVCNMNSALTGTRLGTLFDQPCVAACFDTDILNECIYDFEQKEMMIEALQYQYGDWNGYEHIGISHVESILSCCTKNGIRHYAETGRIGEFPEMYYRAMNVRQRIDVLKRMISLITNNNFKYRVLKSEIRFPKSMQIYWDPDDRAVSFRQIGKDSIVQISIKETSVYNTIVNSIRYVEMKHLVFTNDELIEFVKTLIIELENGKGA